LCIYASLLGEPPLSFSPHVAELKNLARINSEEVAVEKPSSSRGFSGASLFPVNVHQKRTGETSVDETDQRCRFTGNSRATSTAKLAACWKRRRSSVESTGTFSDGTVATIYTQFSDPLNRSSMRPNDVTNLQRILSNTKQKSDTEGRCFFHPEIQLIRRSELGWGWKVLLYSCPRCEFDNALDDAGVPWVDEANLFDRSQDLARDSSHCEADFQPSSALSHSSHKDGVSNSTVDVNQSERTVAESSAFSPPSR